MAYEQILYDVSGGIATITLNRPERLNAWTMRMANEVRHAFGRAGRDETVRVIVVTGSGKGFCSGADIDMLSAVGRGGEVDMSVAAELAVEFDASIPAAFRGEHSYPLAVGKPVIGAINGAAAGLGVSYALYYDMRIASDRARFSFMFSRRGLIAEHGSAWMLPRLIGTANACDLLFSGRMIDAPEALRMGLVNRVVPHDGFMPAVREIALELATRCSPRSMRIMKRQLYSGLASELGPAIEEADREMFVSFGTDDFREGVLSFLEKRPPKFPGG